MRPRLPPMTDAEPLLLLPGLGCDATIWAHQSRAFTNDRDVLIVDYRNAATLGEMADMALAAISGPFALIGHSMGARVALEIIDRAPDRVIRLALFDTGVHPVRPGEMAARQDLLDYGRAFGIAALADRWLPPMVHPDRVDDDAFMAPLRAMVIRCGLAGFERQVGALLQRRDAEPILADIACPTLIGVGAQDGWSPPDQHRGIASAIKGARLTIFEGAGHMAPYETPGPINAALADWLAVPAG